MSLNKTPRASRYHIAFLGRMNSGKSSLINALVDQDVAVVSPIAGTTTDIVHKAMEIHGAGPVVLIDTPGIDDVSLLAAPRIARTRRAIEKADCAIVVVDAMTGEGEVERELYAYLEEKQVPFIVAINKTDLVNDKLSLRPRSRHQVANAPYIEVSAKTHSGKEELLKAISTLASQAEEKKGPPLVGDLFDPGDRVILVIPLDAQAPKGRLILPQVQTIRDILDHGGIAIAVGIEQLKQLFSGKDLAPRLVITDSQAFKEVDRIVPPTIPLTSFSILFARHKGNFDLLVKGAQALDQLRPGDHVLIAEACTHHAIGDDIGTVKIPRLLNTKVGGELNYEWQKGGDYPEDLARSQAVIHCGGCMLNSKAMCSRLKAAAAAGVSITNYGMTIAACYGILPRALEAFQW
jgi:[FeFe] hydrogenase H-cluster maturation GTPase HydF